jgi:serine/threonine-protein kinase
MHTSSAERRAQAAVDNDSPWEARPAADVSGLAAVLYHALSGERPFARSTPEDYVRDLLGRGPTPLEEIAPRLPSRLRALVAQGLAAVPGTRGSAAKLARELDELL